MSKWIEAMNWREVQAVIALAITQAFSAYAQKADWRDALLAGATVLFGGGGLAVLARKCIDVLGKLAIALLAEKLGKPTPK